MPLALFANGLSWRLVGAIGIVVLLAITAAEHARAIHLKTDLDAALRVARDNKVLLEHMQNAVIEANRIADKAVHEGELARQKYAKARQSIVIMPANDDGPVAPVLRRSLDGLSERSGAGGNDAAATHARGTDGMSRRP